MANQHIWPDSALYPLEVHRSMRMLPHTELPSLKLQSAQSRTSHTGRQWGAKQDQSTLLLPIATSSTSCGGGEGGVREEGKRHAIKKHTGAYLEGLIASGLKLG